MENTKLKNIVEAILMSSDRILSLSQIEKMLTEKKTTTKEKPAQDSANDSSKEAPQEPVEMAANDSENTADAVTTTSNDEQSETEPTDDQETSATVNTLKKSIKEVIAELQQDYAERATELKEVASGYRFQVRQEYADEVGKLWEERPSKYSRALLETLVLIAYRQPITRGEIEAIRGVSVSSHIVKTLIEREWVRVIGHRDVPGKPAIYGSTKEFLDYFNLKSLDELPSLAEIKDLDKVAPELALDEAVAAVEDSINTDKESTEIEADSASNETTDEVVTNSEGTTDSNEETIAAEVEVSVETTSDDVEIVTETAQTDLENKTEIEESDQSDSDDVAASQENESDKAELS